MRALKILRNQSPSSVIKGAPQIQSWAFGRTYVPWRADQARYCGNRKVRCECTFQRQTSFNQNTSRQKSQRIRQTYQAPPPRTTITKSTTKMTSVIKPINHAGGTTHNQNNNPRHKRTIITGTAWNEARPKASGRREITPSVGHRRNVTESAGEKDPLGAATMTPSCQQRARW